MMNRFCRYLDKCFPFRHLLPLFTDTRKQPQIPSVAVFASLLALFACNRTSLTSLEKDLVRLPQRLRGLVGPQPPSIDTLGRVYDLADSEGLRQMLAAVHHRLKRNKALADGDDLKIAVVDGHECFASRKRCCTQCQQRTITVQGEEVVEYYHQGVICHLIEQPELRACEPGLRLCEKQTAGAISGRVHPQQPKGVQSQLLRSFAHHFSPCFRQLPADKSPKMLLRDTTSTNLRNC